jgi:hypothetical protein
MSNTNRIRSFASTKLKYWVLVMLKNTRHSIVSYYPLENSNCLLNLYTEHSSVVCEDRVVDDVQWHVFTFLLPCCDVGYDVFVVCTPICCIEVFMFDLSYALIYVYWCTIRCPYHMNLSINSEGGTVYHSGTIDFTNGFVLGSCFSICSFMCSIL